MKYTITRKERKTVTVSKQEFLKAVWSLINTTDTCAFDAVLDVTERYGIDAQTAAKILNSDATLKALVEQRALALNIIKLDDATA